MKRYAVPQREHRGEQAEFLQTWSANHLVLPSLVNSQLSTETQSQCVPVPASRDVPGTVAGKSQPRGPAGPYCSPEQYAVLQSVGWIMWPAFLLKLGQVWEVHVVNRSLLGSEEQHWIILQGSDKTAAPCTAESPGLRGMGCGMQQISAGTNPLCAGMSPSGDTSFQQNCFLDKNIFFGCCSSAVSAKPLWLSFGTRKKPTQQNQAWISCCLASVFCKSGEQNHSSFRNQ